MKEMIKNKRKAALLSGVMIVFVLALAGVTLAFLFTQTDSVENKFKPTETKITIEEDFDGITKENVKIVNSSEEDALPVYVRVKLVYNWYRTGENNAQELVGKSSWEITDDNYAKDEKDELIPIFNTTDWFEGSDDYWYYRYKLPVGAETSNLIDKIVLLQAEDGTHQGLEILAEAIQVDGVGENGKYPVEDAWLDVEVNANGELVLRVQSGN